jgi:hypothetical protein
VREQDGYETSRQGADGSEPARATPGKLMPGGQAGNNGGDTHEEDEMQREPGGAATDTPRFERREAPDDRPLSELVKDLGEQTQTLVRQEMELARTELTRKGRAAGMGLGMFGGAGLFGFFAFAALTACFVLALSTAMAGWLAALIVAAAYAAIAGVLAMTGRSKVEDATPPVPERTRESVTADVETVKAHTRAGRS